MTADDTKLGRIVMEESNLVLNLLGIFAAYYSYHAMQLRSDVVPKTAGKSYVAFCCCLFLLSFYLF